MSTRTPAPHAWLEQIGDALGCEPGADPACILAAALTHARTLGEWGRELVEMRQQIVSLEERLRYLRHAMDMRAMEESIHGR